MTRSTNKVALVTGANHGIGAATARALSENGASVVLTFLRLDGPVDAGLPEEYLRQRARDASPVIDAIRDGGGRAIAIEADLSDSSTVPALFDNAERVFGPVEILVNNASGWIADTFVPTTGEAARRWSRRVSVETFEQQFSIDARATALLIAEFSRRHIERGGSWGRIIGLTSGGNLGFPGEVSYGAAKAALENYTMSAAIELADWGVTANIVHPPVTDTGWITDEVRQWVARSTDHVHIVGPDEVARIIAFLASDEASLLTGNILRLR